MFEDIRTYHVWRIEELHVGRNEDNAIFEDM